MLKSKLLCSCAFGAAALLTANQQAWAQDQGDNAEAEKVNFLEEVVVTGVFRPGANRLESSVTTTSLDEDAIQFTTARTTTEIFRSIPGLRVEASGGDNNANIQARGTPLSEGGAKYVQLQEDGLPVLQFGDIIFGNADNFLRADTTVGRVEAIRGGSASTAASNAPGAVINLVSKTGEVEGGSIGVTRGVDFDTTRVDFEYGSPIGDNYNFHIGGFYRVGEGPRDVGFTGENGGQIKANLTRKFDDDNGFIRFYFKHLNDRVHANLPQPLLVTGTDDNPDFSPIAGFDGSSDQLSTANVTFLPRIDGNDGQIETTDFTDGSRSLVTSVGFEFDREVEGFRVNNKFRFSDISSQFTGILTLSTFNATTAAADLFPGQGASLAFVGGGAIPTGSLAGLNGNGLITSNLVFDTENDSLSNVQNDFRISRTFNLDESGELDISVGYYKNVQQIEQDYFFTELLLEVQGDNAQAIDVLDADGNALTTDGFRTFGIFTSPTFDLEYDRDALYGNVGYTNNRLSVDASIRYERIQASGNSTQGGGPTAQTQQPVDINNDGVIDAAEQNINTPVLTALNPINYVADYVSFSVGANYLITDDFAVFARYSEGASANADRLVNGAGGAAFINPDGSLQDEDVAIDGVDQVEAGFKWDAGNLDLPGNLSVFTTFFYAETEENTGSSGGTGDFVFSVSNDFEAWGIELETRYTSDVFDLSAGVTYSDSDIVSSDDPNSVGDTPQRNADWVYQVTAVGKLGELFLDRAPTDFTLGTSIIGTSESFTEAPNGLVQPGFVQVNLFANYFITDNLRFNAQVNNLFDEFGITEVEEDLLSQGLAAPQAGGTIVRGRPINGRTITVGLAYDF